MTTPFKVIMLFTCSFMCTSLFAQSPLQFTPFVGKAYFIPIEQLEKGHGPHIYDNRIICAVRLDSINIPKTNVKDSYFPYVYRPAQFGVVLKSKLTSPRTGCYELVISSDDGSKLWINEQLVVNNDRPHKMKTITDTVMIEKGTHEAKLWYYNAYPVEYGLIMNHRFLYPTGCENKPQIIDSSKYEIQTLSVQNQMLFDFDKATLKADAYPDLDQLCVLITDKQVKSLTIKGYTDSIGNENYNLDLSSARARAIKNYLEKKLAHLNIEYTTIGMGEADPIDSNETSEGRQANRRVEISFK